MLRSLTIMILCCAVLPSRAGTGTQPTTRPALEVDVEVALVTTGPVDALPLATMPGRGGLGISLWGPDGRRVPGERSSPMGTRSDEAKTLEANESETAIFDVIAHPRVPGRHVVRVEVPTTLKGYRSVRAELGLNVVEMQPEDLVAHLSAPVEVEPHPEKRRRLDGMVQVMKVKGNGEFALIYQFRSADARRDVELRTSRVARLSEDSTLIDFGLSLSQASPLRREIWILFEDDGRRYVARVRHGTGEVIEVSELVNSDPI